MYTGIGGGKEHGELHMRYESWQYDAGYPIFRLLHNCWILN